MEVLYFIIFGGLLLFFIGYGIWMHHKDKKIIKEFEAQEEKKSHAIQDRENKRLLGRRNIPEEDMGFLCDEQPFFGSIESLN
jgi:hypothetical protein